METNVRNRGINKETRTASSPKFKPRMDKHNGLNLVTVSVSITESEGKESSKQLAFIGLQIPSLLFTFTQADADGAEPAKYIHSFRPIDYTDDTTTIEDKDNIESANLEMIYHFMLPIVGRDLTDAEFDTLVLDFGTTKDKNGSIIYTDPSTVSGDVILNAYRKFYNAVLAIILTNTKLSKERFWLKLLLYIKSKAIRNGSPAIPMYVGDGFLERAAANKESSLTIAIAKGESIIPREVIIPKQGVNQGNPSSMPPVTNNAMPNWGDDD